MTPLKAQCCIPPRLERPVLTVMYAIGTIAHHAVLTTSAHRPSGCILGRIGPPDAELTPLMFTQA